MRFFIILLLSTLMLIPGINAQETASRFMESATIELQKRGSWFRVEGEIAIPFDQRTPFTTFAFRFYDVEREEMEVEIAYSPDGRRYSDFRMLSMETHGPDNPHFEVSELVFLGEEVRFLKYRIKSRTKAEIPLEFHYFLPDEDYSMDESELPELESRMNCGLPFYTTRTGWNCPSGQDFSSGNPSFTNVSHLVIHHSAGVSVNNNWPAVVLSIWNYHRFTNGWSDIGYNFLIDPNGMIYEGRGGNNGYTLDVLPAATCGSNSGTMAVCMLGNFETAELTVDALLQLESLLAWKAMDNGIDPEGEASLNNYGVIPNIFGHKDGCATACPGENIYDRLDEIREGVYSDVLNMCDPPPAHVVLTEVIIDDNNDGESTGDGDGVVEVGETVEFYITLENVGGETAYSVFADISTADPCISFIDANIPFNDIDAGEAKTDGDYDIVFSTACDEGIIDFPLVITSEDSVWYDTIRIEVFNNCEPIASFDFDPTSDTAPLTVNFVNTSVNASIWDWTFPGGNPSSVGGLNTVDVVYPEPGVYLAYLNTFNECGSSNAVDTIAVDIVSAVHDQEAQLISLYPNPTKHWVNIDLKQYLQDGEMQIVSLTGQEMRRKVFTGSRLQLDVADLASGIYLIRIKAESSEFDWTGRFEKK